MINNVFKFLTQLAKRYIAFRGTLAELAELMGFDEEEVINAVNELIETNQIIYIIDEGIYTLTVRDEEDDEAQEAENNE